MIKPFIYNDPPVSSNFWTLEKEIMVTYNSDFGHDETPQISLLLVSCILPNFNYDDVSPRGNITKKKQDIRTATKYFPPHLRRNDKIKVPRKEHGKR